MKKRKGFVSNSSSSSSSFIPDNGIGDGPSYGGGYQPKDDVDKTNPPQGNKRIKWTEDIYEIGRIPVYDLDEAVEHVYAWDGEQIVKLEGRRILVPIFEEENKEKLTKIKQIMEGLSCLIDEKKITEAIHVTYNKDNVHGLVTFIKRKEKIKLICDGPSYEPKKMKKIHIFELNFNPTSESLKKIEEGIKEGMKAGNIIILPKSIKHKEIEVEVEETESE